KAPSSALPTTTCACVGHVNLLAPRTSFSTVSFLVSLIRHGGCFCFLTISAFSSILETGTEVKICDVVSTSAYRQRARYLFVSGVRGTRERVIPLRGSPHTLRVSHASRTNRALYKRM